MECRPLPGEEPVDFWLFTVTGLKGKFKKLLDNKYKNLGKWKNFNSKLFYQLVSTILLKCLNRTKLFTDLYIKILAHLVYLFIGTNIS